MQWKLKEKAQTTVTYQFFNTWKRLRELLTTCSSFHLMLSWSSCLEAVEESWISSGVSSADSSLTALTSWRNGAISSLKAWRRGPTMFQENVAAALLTNNLIVKCIKTTSVIYLFCSGNSCLTCLNSFPLTTAKWICKGSAESYFLFSLTRVLKWSLHTEN